MFENQIFKNVEDFLLDIAVDFSKLKFKGEVVVSWSKTVLLEIDPII